MKKITIICLLCVLLMAGCNTNTRTINSNDAEIENNIIGSDNTTEQKDSNEAVILESNSDENNIIEQETNEIITLCSGTPFKNTPSVSFIHDDTPVKENLNLKKYEIQYMNYNNNTDLPYASTGKIKKYTSLNNEECFSVNNVGTIAVSSNVKPITIKLNHIENIPEEIFSLNSDLADFNTFNLYSIQLQTNGKKSYILDASRNSDNEYNNSRGKLVVLDNEYNYLATLLNSNWSTNIDFIQIANIDFDEDLEIIVFGQYSLEGHAVSVFDFIAENVLQGDTLSGESGQ